jgi:hypothetical protein
MSRSTSISTGTVYQVYFGRYIEALNRTVSELDFSKFVKDEIVPEFESFSIQDGVGYWKGEPEPIKVLTIVSQSYEDSLPIHSIAEAYKKRFYQDAVLVNTFSCFPNLV